MEGNEFDKEKMNRYFNEKFDAKDEFYINELFCDSSKEEELKRFLSGKFEELLSEDNVDKKDLDHILYRIHYEINTKLADKEDKKLVKFLKWSLRIAGIIILPLAIIFGVKGYLNGSQEKEAWVEIKAPAWTRAKFSLPDGTTGWLNSNSSVEYNGNFVHNRQVTLKGEAFFDVFKDSKRPFILNTPEINIKVLGTKFNIASYEDETTVDVVLEEGKLIFSDKNMKESYTMKPNELLIYDKTRKDISTEVVQPQKYSSWTEGKLVFRNDPLDIIVRRLERWYDIDVEVNGNYLQDLRWRATFVDESLEQVLYYLKRSLPIDYKIVNSGFKTDDIVAKRKVIITLGPR